jgi:hypothetical protein
LAQNSKAAKSFGGIDTPGALLAVFDQLKLPSAIKTHQQHQEDYSDLLLV